MIEAITPQKAFFYRISTPQKQNLQRNDLHDRVSFRGIRKEKALFLPLLKKLRNSMDIFKFTDFLASGTEGSVYKFKQHNFCIKIPHRIGLFGDWSHRFISSREKANHVIASSKNGAVIMKYLSGFNVKHKPDEIYRLPNSVYKRLLKQISEAYKSGLIFDATGGNVIYNPAKKTLTAIDFSPIEITGSFLNAPFTRLYQALSCPNIYVNPNAHQNNKKLMGKLLSIMLKEIKAGNPSKLEINSVDANYLFLKYETTPELTKYCQKLKEIINEIFRLKAEKPPQTNILNKKIAEAQTIIKRDF